jgi:maleate isomerase
MFGWRGRIGLIVLIVFGCTVGSMIEGKGCDEKICAEITAETGIPAIATTTAVIAALQALGTSRVTVATRGAGQGSRS